jgi:hypothetical protein
MGGAGVTENPLSAARLSAPNLTRELAENGSFGIVDKITGTSDRYYKLSDISGRLNIHALAYSLYSPIHVSISLLNDKGNPVPSEIIDPILTGESGYLDQDSELIANDLPAGDYILKIASTPLQANQYPAGPISLDSVPFFILTGALNGSTQGLEKTLPDNARCFMSENFPSYQSPPGPPAHSSTNPPAGNAGSCATVRYSSESDQNSASGKTPGADSGTILGWLLPWIFMAFVARISTYSHAR